MTLTKEQAKEKISELVDRFKEDLESDKHYNEQQTIDYYIRPFFEALNWHFDNPNEVIPQEKISKGRADYGFRIDDIPKFFVEAKSIKEDVNNNEFAEQAINYAWLKSVTWTILTNFKELKVFNAEWESRNPRDKIYIPLTWNQYIEKFDRVWLLSKDSFLNHELDKEAEEYGKKIKKTPVTPVMNQIFNDLMGWREKLSKSISDFSSNSKIVKNEEELDEAVQRIIDRLIFIRVCEDRNIEQIILQSKLREWQNHHTKNFTNVLNKIFEDFRNNYDSKLFDPHFCENLEISDVALVEVITSLYESSDRVFKYDFSAIEADVLGNIYEEYLGYILQKGKKRTTVKADHLRRKEMGIYYTPTFVVDYIVKNTLSKLLEKMSSAEVDNIKILDMACGSGSFLLKAFDVLNNYYKNKTDPEFAYGKKFAILTDNIYGVDLDPKALEIAQLNLLLKTVEKRQRLPELQNNLKVGNSLIDDSQFSERAFNWDNEFKEKFNVIIGNPPYIRSQLSNKDDKKFFEDTYKSARGQYDIYILFIEKALNLLEDGGYLGFIIPNKFLVSDYGLGIRKLILKESNIIQIIDVSNIGVFKGVGTYPVIFIIQKMKKPDPKNQIKILNNVKEPNALSEQNKQFDVVLQENFVNNEKNLFLTSSIGPVNSIIEKMKTNSTYLKDVSEISRGIIPESQKDYVLFKNDYDKLAKQEKELCRKAIRARDVNRYTHQWKNEYFFYHKKLNITRSKKFEEPKILMPRTVINLKASYDEDSYTPVDRLYLIKVKNKKFEVKFILALLNSKLISFYYRSLFGATHLQGGYLDLKGIDLEKIPIKFIPAIEQDDFTKLVDKILNLNKELQETNPGSDRDKKLQLEINGIDKQIDQKTYKLYDLTEDEIKIVEET